MQQQECPSVTSPSSRSRIDPAANLHSQIFGFTARGRLCSSRPGGRGPAVTVVAAPRSMAGREASWGRGCAGAGAVLLHPPSSISTHGPWEPMWSLLRGQHLCHERRGSARVSSRPPHGHRSPIPPSPGS